MPRRYQGMVPRKRFDRSNLRHLVKANAAKASNLDNFHGLRPLSSPLCDPCQRKLSLDFVASVFSIFCPSVPQPCDLCKPLSTCFRPVFRAPCLLRRRYRLTFALVCSSGCKEVEASASKSTPAPNVEQNGEKLKNLQDLSRCTVLGPWHVHVLFCLSNWLSSATLDRCKTRSTDSIKEHHHTKYRARR